MRAAIEEGVTVVSEEKIYDTIIIGAGPAGMTAAVYTSREIFQH